MRRFVFLQVRHAFRSLVTGVLAPSHFFFEDGPGFGMLGRTVNDRIDFRRELETWILLALLVVVNSLKELLSASE